MSISAKTRSVHWHTLVPALLQEGHAVIDLGANVGRFSKEIVDSYGCIVYSVEPDPELFRLIPKHPLIVPIQAAVAEKSGEALFGFGENRLGGSILDTDNDRFHSRISVKTLTFDDLMSNVHEPIAAVKMDIEGSEIPVLSGISDEVLMRIPQLTIEFHDFNGHTPAVKVREIVDRMRSLGFYYLRMSRVGHQDTLFVNVRSGCFSTLNYYHTKLVSRNSRGLRRVVRRAIGLPPKCM